MRSNDKKVNILIAYEVLIACEFYAQALNRRPGFHVVAHTTTARGAVEAARHNSIDVALISATLSDGANSGLAVLRATRNYCSQTKAIILLDRSNSNLVVCGVSPGIGVITFGCNRVFSCIARSNERNSPIVRSSTVKASTGRSFGPQELILIDFEVEGVSTAATSRFQGA